MGQVVTGRPPAKQLAALPLDSSKDELEHQQELAERIASLGGKPVADVSKLAQKTYGKDLITSNLIVHILSGKSSTRMNLRI